MAFTRDRRSGSRLLFHARYTDGVVDALTGQAHTFARSSEGLGMGSAGVFAPFGHSRPRIEVYQDIPALLLEADQTNVLLRSTDFDTTWTAQNSPTLSDVSSAIPGQNATLFVNNGTASTAIRQDVSTLTASPETFYVILRRVAGTTQSEISLFDNTAAGHVAYVRLTWSTLSTAVVSSALGSSVSHGARDLGDDLALLWLVATPDNSDNNRRLFIYATGASTNTESVGIHAAQHAEAGYVTSPIVTAGSSDSRGATDVLYYDWSVPAATAWSALVKFVAPPAGSPALLRIGGAAPDLVLDVSSGEIRVTHDNNSSTVSSTTSGATWSAGDVVEARVRFGTDGKVTAAASVNEGAEVVGTQSSALSIASWGSARIYPGGLTAEQNRLEVREIKVHADPDATLTELREAA